MTLQIFLADGFIRWSPPFSRSLLSQPALEPAACERRPQECHECRALLSRVNPCCVKYKQPIVDSHTHQVTHCPVMLPPKRQGPVHTSACVFHFIFFSSVSPFHAPIKTPEDLLWRRLLACWRVTRELSFVAWLALDACWDWQHLQRATHAQGED